MEGWKRKLRKSLGKKNSKGNSAVEFKSNMRILGVHKGAEDKRKE